MKKKIMKPMIGSLLLALLCLVVTEVSAQSPYGFRGPTRNGIYPETGLLKTWPAAGPELLWETLDAGKGYSSPLVVGDRLYLTGMNEDEDKEIFSAYTLDGTKVYTIVYGSPWSKSYPETRTTPMIVDGKAYVISGMGEVVCINTADGAILWTVNGEQFGRKTGTWGTSECPLVFDGKVLFAPGGDQTAIVALNAENGEVVWKSRSLNDISNYASPILVSHNGKKQIVTLTGKYIIGVNPDNGDIQWTFDTWGESAQANGWEKIAPNAPIYKDGLIMVSNGYDIGTVMLKLNDDLSAVEEVWRNSDLDTHHGSYVLVDGIVYGSNWLNNTSGNWVAVDWSTGQTKYNEAWGGGSSKGSIISADGMLYCYDERRGAIGLVRPTPEKFDVVSRFRITKGEGPHWAHLVINDGVLYVRHGNALMAYKVK